MTSPIRKKTGIRPPKILFSLICALVIFLAGLAVFAYLGQNKTLEKTVARKGYQFAKPSHQIKQFKYTGHLNSRRLITIQSAILTIRKKKLGFVRIGLLQTIELVNADITLYTYPEKDTQEMPDMDSLKTMFKTKSNPIQSFGNVSGVDLFPVTVTLLSDNQRMASLSAGACSLSFSETQAIFTHNVVLTSGKNQLKVDRLFLNTENGMLKGENFIFDTPGRTRSGQWITADILLEKVSF